MTRTRLSLALVAVALAAAACGGSGKPAAQASSPNNADQMLKFTECLRRHGVNVPDPGTAHGIRISAAPGQEGKINGAVQACRSLDPGKFAGRNDPAARDHELKMAECLRKHGLDVPDPQPGQPLMVRGSRNVPNPEQIDQECQKEIGAPK